MKPIPRPSWHQALARKAKNSRARRSLKARRLQAECERIDHLDLPWSLDMPPGNGFFNCRGVHATAGYTVNVRNRSGDGDGVRYDWEWAENARMVARAAIVHASGRLEFQGPFEVAKGFEDLVLTVPRQYPPQPAPRDWLSACGVADPFARPGGDESCAPVTAG